MVKTKVDWDEDYHNVWQCCNGTYWEAFPLEMVGVMVGTTVQDLGIQLCASCVCKGKQSWEYYITLQAGGKCATVMHYYSCKIRFAKNGGGRKASVPTQILALVIAGLVSTKACLDTVTHLVFKGHQGFYQTWMGQSRHTVLHLIAGNFRGCQQFHYSILYALYYDME